MFPTGNSMCESLKQKERIRLLKELEQLSVGDVPIPLSLPGHEFPNLPSGMLGHVTGSQPAACGWQDF